MSEISFVLKAVATLIISMKKAPSGKGEYSKHGIHIIVYIQYLDKYKIFAIVMPFKYYFIIT